MFARLSRRNQDRLAALFPLVAVGFFAALSFWLDARVSASARPPRATSNAPEQFMEGFRIERSVAVARGRDASAPVQDALRGRRADYYPDAGKAVIAEPVFRSEAPGKPRLDVAAERATIEGAPRRGEVERIVFEGGVRLDQAAVGSRPPVRFETESITVFPATQEAVTDRPTRTTLGPHVLVTQGIHIDRAGQRVTSSRGVRLEFLPKEGP